MKTVTDRPDSILVGCQNAWSSHPLMTELQKCGPRLQIQKDDCGGLYRKLDHGELLYAFCSSISLVRNAEFEMALPVGISVDGPSGLALWGFSSNHLHLKECIEERVKQLAEVFKKAQLMKVNNLKQATQNLAEGLAALPPPRLSKFPPLRLTSGYSSWGTLSRLLYRLIFGADAYEALMRMDPAQDFAVDGIDFRLENEALQKRCSYTHWIDLSELWCRITGLPFVSSVLQKKRKTCSCRQNLAEVGELAQMRMQVEPCNYLPDMPPRNQQQQQIDLCSVWKNLSYRLSSEDMRSLQVFLYLAKPIEKKSLEDSAFMLKMLRWQQKDISISGQMA